MELRVLEYFLAAAREQNITAAAESLHLTQPILSIQLKELEEELGKKLLIRGTKGSRKVTLTEDGKLLRARAEEILNLARFPAIHYHFMSGNANYVLEQLDNGLVDFGLVFGEADEKKYNVLHIPKRERWGVLLRRDDPLAQKEKITPEDLRDQPLIVSAQEDARKQLAEWMHVRPSGLHVAATYNLILNAAILTDEKFGYTIGYDKLLDTVLDQGNSSLCFRPLDPVMEAEAVIIWKKYQIFSKAADLFLQQLQKALYIDQEGETKSKEKQE